MEPRWLPACNRIRYTARMAARLLFIGDVVGEPGRRAVREKLRELRERHRADLVVVNGENSAGGVGITERTANDLLKAGADVITTGNHVYRHRNVYAFLDSTDRVIRPANYLDSNPGRGHTVVSVNGVRWAVINLSGGLYLHPARSPFHVIDDLLHRLERTADLVIVDFHGEATSEKVAMGWHLDGRVLAVLGTHTHVPTADARVLPGGTAYLSDVGMTGARGGVIGVKREQAIERFLTELPVKFETATEDVWIMGCVVESGEGGLARSIELVMLAAD
jgi:2',3'-cyclic-nucleotide 2'-phosphodiesterase